MLRLAVQKSGRLSDASLDLISECGIELERNTRKLKIPAFNFPLEILTCRDDDMPRYVEQGVVDAAIVGGNVLQESGGEGFASIALGFGRCRLSIAVPKEMKWEGLESLTGLRIATSYPRILGDFLSAEGIQADIREISGAVEITPGIGVADAICDLVSSGSTLLSNGLREVLPVMNSEALLVQSPKISSAALGIFADFSFRIDAVLRAKRTKYITLNTPNSAIERIIEILPGLKSPSIMPLANSGWSSLHTVVSEDNFWGLITQLRAVGAQGILVMPIEKVIL